MQDEIGRVLMDGQPWYGLAVSNVDEPIMAAVRGLDRRHQMFHVHREIVTFRSYLTLRYGSKNSQHRVFFIPE